MNKSNVAQQIRDYLGENQNVANDAAPGLKLLRQALVCLELPEHEDGASSEDLAAADRSIVALRDALSDREEYIYSLLSEMNMLPEEDGEPVNTLGEALEVNADILDDLFNAAVTNAVPLQPADTSEESRFISAVKSLVGMSSNAQLESVWNALETKAQYMTNLEVGIAERDRLLAEADQRVTTTPAPHPMEPVAFDFWISDAIDLAHAVRGNLSPENRVMAKAAEQLIVMAPRGDAQ